MYYYPQSIIIEHFKYERALQPGYGCFLLAKILGDLRAKEVHSSLVFVLCDKNCWVRDRCCVAHEKVIHLHGVFNDHSIMASKLYLKSLVELKIYQTPWLWQRAYKSHIKLASKEHQPSWWRSNRKGEKRRGVLLSGLFPLEGARREYMNKSVGGFF